MCLESFKKLESEKKYKEIIAKYEELSLDKLSPESLAHIQYIVAKSFFLLGQLDKTRSIVPEVIKWAKDHDENLFLSSVSLKANSFSIKGEFNQAKEIFEELFEQTKNIEQYENYPILLLNYAHTFFYTGDIIKAHEKYKKALDISKEKGLPTDKILSNLSLTYNQLGEYEKAIDLVEKALKKKEEQEDWHGWIIAKINASSYYTNVRKFEEAHKYVDRALKYAENKLFQRELAGAYSAKGSVLIREKDILEAYDYLRSSKAILERIGVKDILPETLVRLGFVSIILEEFGETQQIINQLNKLAEETESHFYVIWSASLDALLKYEQEKDKNALSLIEKALNVALEFKLYSIYLSSSYLAYYIYIAEGKFDEVEPLIKKILEIAKDKESALDIIKHVLILCFLYASKGDCKAILEYEDEINKLMKEYTFFSSDFETLSEYYAELASIEEEEKIDAIRRDAYDHLLDFLQRVNPWF